MHVDIMPQLGRKRRKQEKLSWCHILSFAFVSLPRMISLLRPRTFSFTRPYSSTPEAGKPVRQRFQSSSNISINYSTALQLRLQSCNWFIISGMSVFLSHWLSSLQAYENTFAPKEEFLGFLRLIISFRVQFSLSFFAMQ